MRLPQLQCGHGVDAVGHLAFLPGGTWNTNVLQCGHGVDAVGHRATTDDCHVEHGLQCGHGVDAVGHAAALMTSSPSGFRFNAATALTPWVTPAADGGV